MSKLLVISGASKGIGLATACHFAENGYRILNLSRSPCSAPNTVNISVDMLDRNWMETRQQTLLAEAAETEQIVLIHNAAMLTKDSVINIDADSLGDVLQLNVVAAAQLNSLFIPFMKPGSSILYVGSTLSTKAVANTYAYVISKHALVGQMRATCQDLVGRRVHTACVCPGFTETKMLRDHLGQNPEVYNKIKSTIVYERLVQPDEIANTLWFCSQNPVINGALIDANLGQIEQ